MYKNQRILSLVLPFVLVLTFFNISCSRRAKREAAPVLIQVPKTEVVRWTEQPMVERPRNVPLNLQAAFDDMTQKKIEYGLLVGYWAAASALTVELKAITDRSGWRREFNLRRTLGAQLGRQIAEHHQLFRDPMILTNLQSLGRLLTLHEAEMYSGDNQYFRTMAERVRGVHAEVANRLLELSQIVRDGIVEQQDILTQILTLSDRYPDLLDTKVGSNLEKWRHEIEGLEKHRDHLSLEVQGLEVQQSELKTRIQQLDASKQDLERQASRMTEELSQMMVARQELGALIRQITEANTSGETVVEVISREQSPQVLDFKDLMQNWGTMLITLAREQLEPEWVQHTDSAKTPLSEPNIKLTVQLNDVTPLYHWFFFRSGFAANTVLQLNVTSLGYARTISRTVRNFVYRDSITAGFGEEVQNLLSVELPEMLRGAIAGSDPTLMPGVRLSDTVQALCEKVLNGKIRASVDRTKEQDFNPGM